MNREIEFRGKHIHALDINKKLDGTWVYGYLCDDNYIYSEKLGGDMLVDKSTIGQYTGLKDKNGKKIFEGDILREYSNEIQDWIVSYEYGKFVGTFDNVCEDLYELSDFEVIGNLWENGEILNDSKNTEKN